MKRNKKTAAIPLKKQKNSAFNSIEYNENLLGKNFGLFHLAKYTNFQ